MSGDQFAWSIPTSQSLAGHTIAIAAQPGGGDWQSVMTLGYDGSHFASLKVSAYQNRVCVGWGEGYGSGVWNLNDTRCTSPGFGVDGMAVVWASWSADKQHFVYGVGDSEVKDNGSYAGWATGLIGWGTLWVQPWGGGTSIGAAQWLSGSERPAWADMVDAGPVDDCQFVESGGGNFDDGVVELDGRNARVKMVGTTCGAARLVLTVQAVGGHGTALAFLGANDAPWFLLVRSDGHFWFSDGTRGVDLGLVEVGRRVEWDTANCRWRTSSPSGPWSQWIPDGVDIGPWSLAGSVPACRLVRDASTPPVLMEWGWPNDSSDGLVLGLSGNWTTDAEPGSDPASSGSWGAGDDGSAVTGCSEFSDIGLNPASWVPAVVGGVECLVGRAISAGQALLVPSDAALQAELAKFSQFGDKPPLQWLIGGIQWVQASDLGFSRWADTDLGCIDTEAMACMSDMDAGGWTMPTPLFGVLLASLWVGIVVTLGKAL